MQPVHPIDEGRWAEKHVVPERARRALTVRSLRDAGVALVSDRIYRPTGVSTRTSGTIEAGKRGDIAVHPDDTLRIDGTVMYERI